MSFRGRGKHGPVMYLGLGGILVGLWLWGCTPMPIYTSKNYTPPPQKPVVADPPVVQEKTIEQLPEPATTDTLVDTPEPLEQVKSIIDLPVVAPTAEQQGKYRQGQVLTGRASFYGPGFHGKKTANGEIYNQNALTCAHRELPFGTVLEVTYKKTGQKVRVRVNDRGPYKHGRIIDLSVAAARRIGLYNDGTGEVTAKIIKMGER